MSDSLIHTLHTTSSGLGLAYVRHLLQHTRLQVVATTSGDPGAAESKILDNLSSSASTNPGHRDRLTCVKLDVLDEASVQGAAKEVQDRFGRGSLRLLINVAGVVSVVALRCRLSVTLSFCHSVTLSLCHSASPSSTVNGLACHSKPKLTCCFLLLLL